MESIEIINSLPPELMENILVRINEPTLFTCRLVSRHWNSWASKELERRNILYWTNWEAIPRSSFQLELPISPTLFVEEIDDIGNTLEKFINSRFRLPRAFKPCKIFKVSLGPKPTNTFPANSLRIGSTCSDFSWTPRSIAYTLRSTMRWGKFFRQYGIFLTSVHFHDIELAIWKVKKVLIHTPNLQILTICDPDWRYKSVLLQQELGLPSSCTTPGFLSLSQQELLSTNKMGSMKCERITISPNLSTLHIQNDCPTYLADWLLSLCAHQLVNLSIKAEDEELLLCFCRRKFEKLKQLRIFVHRYSKTFCETWQVEANPELQYLSIVMGYTGGEDGSELEYKTYMDFIAHFSSTLVHLCLNMAPVSRGYLGYLKAKRIIFPQLRSLTLLKRTMDVEWEGTQGKEDAEALFPNVSSINVVWF